MARTTAKLSERRIQTEKRLGRHSDGGNLYLSISPNGGKRWVFMYRFDGRQKEIGLGSAKSGASTGIVREMAQRCRDWLAQGKDPKAEREAEKAATRTSPTFGAFAAEYIASHRSKWRNEKHAAQWQMTLTSYCEAIRAMPVNAIDTEAILQVLKPIWASIPETASRLRGRIENVLDAAKARGFLTLENPARWRGHLKTLLPARQRLARSHHSALPYDDAPKFMTDLRAVQSPAAMALELAILTALRSGEVLNAKWSEFDLAKAIWTIPAIRMKAGHEHRVPLVPRAVAILKSLPKLPHNEHVFPGSARGKPVSAKAMAMLLRQMKRDDITVHGFRSTFRDWASEQTSFPHETCEHALAHRISDKAEAAYRRGDQFEKRRKLMEAWVAFCGPRVSGKVVRLRRQ